MDPTKRREAKGSPLFKLIGMEKKTRRKMGSERKRGTIDSLPASKKGLDISKPSRPDQIEITSARLDTLYTGSS